MAVGRVGSRREHEATRQHVPHRIFSPESFAKYEPCLIPKVRVNALGLWDRFAIRLQAASFNARTRTSPAAPSPVPGSWLDADATSDPPGPRSHRVHRALRLQAVPSTFRLLALLGLPRGRRVLGGPAGWLPAQRLLAVTVLVDNGRPERDTHYLGGAGDMDVSQLAYLP